MIKAQDLRIGNIVSYRGELFEVFDLICKSSVELDSKKLDRHVNNADLNNIFPVEISQEILLKVGFVSDELNGSFETFENGLKFTIIDKCGACMIYLSGPFGMIVLKHIKFVNELQNLFNSLTSKELNTAGFIL